MRSDFQHELRLAARDALGHRGAAALLCVLALAGSLAGCASVRSASAELPALPPIPPMPQILTNRSTPLQTALAYHETLRGMNASELARERSAQSGAGNAPLAQIKQAMLLSHPPQGATSLQRAQSLLEALNASEKADAVALQPLARVLAEQVQERLRLESTAERLTQQLERTGQQLKDAQKQGEELQAKLDALTEIERTLPARPSASTPTQSTPRERRTEK
ncbi:hypothetical protein GPA22_12085 [Aromatoleum toluvorans]|uniref:YfhG lipoprotein n=1 Tax=Aromatoleum toluvorans TaxID=92002 RepID=A0ABX1PZC2_9RHOO|nr:hypothetical protein [Aromatoleum toluvorans]NMG44468.1 hypothetical protein [Aromatoleum toluvorans]